MNRLHTLAVAAPLMAVAPSVAHADAPFYDEPGQLTPGSGEGRVDDEVYAPGMRFPIEEGPAYANSQVWGNGGSEGPSGSECDEENFAYPWKDNYCESRSWDMPLCPAGVGHQGQDIRASTCDDQIYWNVAAEAGTITSVGSYSVYVTAPDGTRFDYLHGRGNIVSEGQNVAKEERINLVSNAFGDGGWTTVHLHFNIKQDIAGVGFVYVPPYMSLVRSYEELMGLGTAGARGAVESKDCTGIVGWAQNLDAPDEAAQIEVYFDGSRDDPNATGVQLLADYDRPDLCDELGSCGHGFEVEIPRSLRDDRTHPAYVYVLDDTGTPTEAEESPVAFACLTPDIPAGVKRAISGPQVLAAWRMSPLWLSTAVDEGSLAAVDDGAALPDAPRLISDGAQGRWLVDTDRRRPVSSPSIASAWSLDWSAAEVWSEEQLSDLPVGAELPDEPFLLAAPDGSFYVMDTALCDLSDPECVPGGDTGDDEPNTGETEGGTEGGEALPGEDSPEDGCGCQTTPGRAGAAFLLLGLAAIPRRRRRDR